mgnify:CR=1 FL=1
MGATQALLALRPCHLIPPTVQRVFSSRIDAWLAAVVLLAGGLLLLPCRYALAGDHLHIRCGLICQRIAYRDITCTLSDPRWTQPAGDRRACV